MLKADSTPTTSAAKPLVRRRTDPGVSSRAMLKDGNRTVASVPKKATNPRKGRTIPSTDHRLQIQLARADLAWCFAIAEAKKRGDISNCIAALAMAMRILGDIEAPTLRADLRKQSVIDINAWREARQ